MRFIDFISYTDEEQKKIFRDWIDNTDFAKGMLLRGHSEDRHCELDEIELLNRVVKDMVSSSTFDTKEDEEFNAGEILYFYTGEIIDWLTKGRENFDDISKYRTLELSAELYSISSDENIVCKGIDKNFNEKETTMGKLIIERNLNVSTQDGKFFCYIKTFYPDIEHETAKTTSRNFTQEATKLINEGVYVEGERFELPATKRAYWAFKMAGYKPYEKVDFWRGQCLAVPFEIGGFKFRVEFDDTTPTRCRPYISVKTQTPDNKMLYLKLKENKELTIDIANAAQDYGLFLKKVFDSVACGKEVEKAFADVSVPDSPYEVNIKFEKKEEEREEEIIKDEEDLGL